LYHFFVDFKTVLIKTFSKLPCIHSLLSLKKIDNDKGANDNWFKVILPNNYHSKVTLPVQTQSTNASQNHKLETDPKLSNNLP
jgi:hypothetical protein